MEYWDAYDKDLNKLDFTLTRGEEIPKDVYHLVSEVLVRHTDGDFLLMQRDKTKEVFPGYYESSAGGSALVGESARDAIIRELYEETGINTFKSLVKVHQESYKSVASIFVSFICITDYPKDKIILQNNETINYQWVSTEDYIKYTKSDYCLSYQIERLSSYIKSL